MVLVQNNKLPLMLLMMKVFPTLTFDEPSYTVVEGNLPTGGGTATPTVMTLEVGLSHVSTEQSDRKLHHRGYK